MTLLCISNSMDGVRSCTVRGHHLSACAWGQAQALLEAGEALFSPTVRECVGCLPRPAETGMLCRSCNEKFTAALDIGVDLITHLRSVERGPSPEDGVRTATVNAPTYPESWQEADQLWMYLAGVAIAHASDKRIDEPVWPTWASVIDGFGSQATMTQVMSASRDLVDWVAAAPVDVVSRTMGAMSAVYFYRAVQRALARFPLEEKSRPVKYIRCRTCQQHTLRWMPPLDFEEPVVIQCSNLTCGALWDPAMLEWDMKVLRESIEAEMKAKEAVA